MKAGKYPMVTGLADTLKQIWSESLNHAGVKETDSFFALGGDSLAAVAMATEVERRTGLPVPVGQIYLTPVLMEFREALERMDPDSKAPIFIPMRESDGKLPTLFGVAPAMGGIFHFKDLAEALPPGQGFAVLEPQVAASGAHPYDSVEDLAAHCLTVMRSKQPQGPWLLAGYSFGGIVAWEMARQMEASGDPPALLMLLDTNSRHSYAIPGDLNSAERVLAKARFVIHCGRIRSDFGEPFYLARCWPLFVKKVVESVIGRPHQRLPGQPLGAADMEVAAQRSLSKTYQRCHYNGTVHLFRSDHQLTLHREIDYDLGWSEHTGDGKLHIITVPGDHFSLMRHPSSVRLARHFMEGIAAVGQAHLKQIENECAKAEDCIPLPFTEPHPQDDLMERLGQVTRAYPEKTALCDGTVRLSYSRLSETAARIATTLLTAQPDSSAPVLLHFESNWQFVVAIYGVLMAGRAYVPLDPAFPPARIREIATLSEAKAAISLDPDTLRSSLPEGIHITHFDTASSGDPGSRLLPVNSAPEAPAIYLFTSGSTGKPKGSAVSRRMLLHLCWRHHEFFKLRPQDRYAVLYVSAFMGAVGAIHPPLLSGGCLCFYNLRRRGLKTFGNWIAEERITILHAITSIQRAFYSSLSERLQLPHLRLVLPGGEPLRTSDLPLWKSRLPAGVPISSGIGSTECGTLCSYWLPEDYQHDGRAFPIGHPPASMGVTVERPDGTPAEPGEEGEIVVTSHYIFEGYLNRPDLNEALLTRLPDGRIRYQTGDYGYFDTEGLLFNLGRHDARVKVMGNLVELAEIEAVLHESGLVEEVSVALQPASTNQEPQLVAFFRPARGQDAQLESRLASIIMRTLPLYMMPARWVRMSEFPRTITGKIDRMAMLTFSHGATSPIQHHN